MKNIKRPEDKSIIFRLLVSLLMSILYFFLIRWITIISYDSLYFEPTVTIALTIVNIGIFICIAISVDRNTLILAKEHKKVTAMVSTILICLTLLPICFFKTGLVADEISIKRKNMFGRTTREYLYEDIINIDISIRHGIQYDIQFECGESVFLVNEVAFVNNFENDINLMNFDKVISKYKEKTITSDIPNNIQRFFKDKVVFEYFQNFFNNY